MSKEPQRTCPSCGNEFSGAMEFCPVCLLRKGLAGEVESGGSSSGDTLKSITDQPSKRFDHYELVTGEDGKPVELGRGAMGVTYKAFDINLRCSVTLKVISERYLSDESARLRFLREARAAASVRHPNVASVFHLGRTGDNHFYAMEFVEGETLERLIKRSGRLEVKLALEIATQVAAGLAAVHEQHLVHRDIKSANIMVRLKEGGAVTAKIIDLGLAKAVNEPGSQTAISTPGGFAGTPEFASPEQFAGVGVDIRSDLYSLGVALWEMGQSELAVQHIRAMVEGIPLDFVKEHAAIAESFVGLPYEVFIRFGRWDDILAAPDHPDFMPLTRAIRFAARGIALAAKGDVAGAKLEQQAYLAAVPLVPAEQTAGTDTRQAILPVVTLMLAGEILYREGRRDEGFAKLREAVRAEDALPYSEPPEWILPARHSLGAALMQERRFAEAEQVYRDDLARLPENGWSLFGLAQSLQRQGKEEEAVATDARFQKIWSKAHMRIKSSCLCQQGI